MMETNISLILHGRGFVTTHSCLKVVVRLRDPTGLRSVHSAEVTGSTGGKVTLASVDHAGNVAVEVARAADRGSTRSASTVSFNVVAQLQ